ncbi:MAG: transglutaminase-like cysteine peptidase [Hyphomicrobiales bacterium]
MLAGVAATEASASYQDGFGQHRRVPARKISRKGGKLPPFAYIQMCVKNPALCRNQPGRLATAGTKVRMTQKLHSQLASVNAAVNRKIKPVRDGKTDTWNVNVSRGDCEDYALTKRAQLLARGWPSSALSIAVVRTHRGAKHAVLVVETTNGRFVLDNLNRSVVPIARASYRFLTMQVSGSGRQWQRL